MLTFSRLQRTLYSSNLVAEFCSRITPVSNVLQCLHYRVQLPAAAPEQPRLYATKLRLRDDDDDDDAQNEDQQSTAAGTQPKEVVIQRRLQYDDLYKFPDYFVTMKNLRDNPGSRKEAKRKGHGGAGGSQAGRGTKGRKARQGRRPHILDDGGQDGLKKFPLLEIKPPREALFQQLSLGRVIDFIQRGKLDPTQLITMKELRDSGCAYSNVKYGILLYGGGCCRLNIPIHIQVTACDEHAKKAVEAVGGTLTRVYYTTDGLRAMLLHELYIKHRIPLPRAAVNWHPRMDGLFDMCGQIIPDRTTIPPVIPPRPLMPGRPPKPERYAIGAR